MRNAENASDIRPLTGAEVNEVSGGLIFEAIAYGTAVLVGALVGAELTTPSLLSVEEMAAKSGFGHIL